MCVRVANRGVKAHVRKAYGSRGIILPRLVLKDPIRHIMSLRKGTKGTMGISTV